MSEGDSDPTVLELMGGAGAMVRRLGTWGRRFESCVSDHT